MINFVTGDATLPNWEAGWGKTLIAHIVNDAGTFNAGFAKALKERYPAAEGYYMKAITDYNVVPGNVIYAPVRDDLKVAHMVAMHGVYSHDNPNPLQYDALMTCLEKLASHAERFQASVHMPKIGSGLARGNWDIIVELIKAAFRDSQVHVYIYEY